MSEEQSNAKKRAIACVDSSSDSRMTTEGVHEHKFAKKAPSSRLSWLAQLDIDQEPSCIRKTSIICTIGPNTSPVEKIVELRKAGMNVARLNFSHGTHAFHTGIVNNVRKSFEVFPGRPVAIALDTKGPEMRTGDVTGGALQIPKDHEFVLTTDEKCKSDGNLERVYVDYHQIGESVDVGKLVYVDDGNLQLKVIESLGAKGVRVRALNSHRLLNHKGVNLPYSKVFLPALSDKDKADLALGIELDVDMIFASFIRSADDVRQIRAMLGAQSRILIIAKIENHEGVKNFDDILGEADGIMVARGDLGVEIPPQKVFIAQKMMIARANLAGKPAICATQMLESMTQNPRPTRAEVSDVANAVLDGADCVMLSAETASGQYPMEAVKTMSSICVEAESTIAYSPLFAELRKLHTHEQSVTETVACSAVNASLEGYISCIVVLTTSGATAHLLSKFRPQVPIIAITRDEQTARQIHLWRGCYPLVYTAENTGGDWRSYVDIRFNWAIEESTRMGLIRPGGHIILIQGDEKGSGHTNTMRILPDSGKC
jgi:pyruvate kinase